MIATSAQQARIVAAADAYIEAIAIPEFLNPNGRENNFEAVSELAMLAVSGVLAALNARGAPGVVLAAGVGQAAGALLGQASGAARDQALDVLQLGLQLGADRAAGEFAARGSA